MKQMNNLHKTTANTLLKERGVKSYICNKDIIQCRKYKNEYIPRYLFSTIYCLTYCLYLLKHSLRRSLPLCQ